MSRQGGRYLFYCHDCQGPMCLDCQCDCELAGHKCFPADEEAEGKRGEAPRHEEDEAHRHTIQVTAEDNQRGKCKVCERPIITGPGGNAIFHCLECHGPLCFDHQLDCYRIPPCDGVYCADCLEGHTCLADATVPGNRRGTRYQACRGRCCVCARVVGGFDWQCGICEQRICEDCLGDCPTRKYRRSREEELKARQSASEDDEHGSRRPNPRQT